MTRWRELYPLLAVAFLLSVPSAPAAASGRMSVDDVVALLKAGVGEKVILRQVETTGTRLTLSVQEILRLKAAGATDDLLAALVGPEPAEASASESAGPSFRIFREKNEKGEEVLHITNLDASGRRMGGEVKDHIPANVIRREEASPSRREREEPYDDPYEDEDRQAPVIVNIYPPEAPDSGSGMTGGYIPEGIAYPGGRYAGYLPGYGPGIYHPCRHPGHRGLHPSPPGSYSHFLRFHHPDGTGLFSQPRSFSTLPYRIHTAAQRNRVRFGSR